MMRNGNFLRDKLNNAIQKLILEAGLIEKIKSQYTRMGSMDEEAVEDDDEENSVAPLTTYHLEGAFAILALGYGVGFVVLLIEITCFKIRIIKCKND